jgi:hypothetical protein
LASVIMGSTTRRSSLALGTVVLMASCSMQRIHHVAQHRQAVLAGAVEFTKAVSVTHGAFLSF